MLCTDCLVRLILTNTIDEDLRNLCAEGGEKCNRCLHTVEVGEEWEGGEGGGYDEDEMK